METEINWLQVSDLHVFDTTATNLILEGYRKLAEVVKPPFIIVSGDFRHKKYQECTFEKGFWFLSELIHIFNVKKEDVFIVPGNHDVNDFSNKKEYVYFTRGNVCINPDIYKDHLGEYMCSFSEYDANVKKFYKGSSVNDSRVTDPSSVQCILWNNQINIILINTCLISDGNINELEVVDIYGLVDLIVVDDLTDIRDYFIILDERGTLRQAVGLSFCDKLLNYSSNRHLAEWRLLRFTIIVIVNDHICKVMRIPITSFRRMMANRLPLCSVPQCPYGQLSVYQRNGCLVNIRTVLKFIRNLYEIHIMILVESV